MCPTRQRGQLGRHVADGSSVRLVKASLRKCDLGVKGGGKSFVSRSEF
jgi:hypothetical protein